MGTLKNIVFNIVRYSHDANIIWSKGTQETLEVCTYSRITWVQSDQYLKRCDKK